MSENPDRLNRQGLYGGTSARVLAIGCPLIVAGIMILLFRRDAMLSRARDEATHRANILNTSINNGHVAEVKEYLASARGQRDPRGSALVMRARVNALEIAAAHGDTPLMRSVLTEFTEKDAEGQPCDPLRTAALAGRTVFVKDLLNMGWSPDGTGNDASPLVAATAFARKEIVVSLIGKGADVNKKTMTDGITPLMQAAYLGNADLVSLFLSNRADPSIRSRQGQSAAQMAAQRGYPKVAALINAQAKRAKRNKPARA